MLTGIVQFSLRFRSAVLALAVLVLMYAGYTLTRAQYDIFPEFLPPQITVQTEAPGLTPEQVETLVTIPVEGVIHGVSDVESLRSSSIQGLSVIKGEKIFGIELLHLVDFTIKGGAQILKFFFELLPPDFGDGKPFLEGGDGLKEGVFPFHEGAAGPFPFAEKPDRSDDACGTEKKQKKENPTGF